MWYRVVNMAMLFFQVISWVVLTRAVRTCNQCKDLPTISTVYLFYMIIVHVFCAIMSNKLFRVRVRVRGTFKWGAQRNWRNNHSPVPGAPDRGQNYRVVQRAPRYDIVPWKHFPHYWSFVMGIHWFSAIPSFSLVLALIRFWIHWPIADDLRHTWYHCNTRHRWPPVAPFTNMV